MKPIKKLLGLLLVAALALSLMTAAAFADKDEAPGKTEAGDAAETVSAEEAAEAGGEDAEAPTDAAEETPDGGDPKPLVCGKGEKLGVSEGVVLCEEGGVVYNCGAVVYNNGGTVYNNFGIVYNNGGTAYNNSGTVYVNGGTVYNNGGNVFFNGGELVDNRAAALEEAAEAPLEEAGDVTETEAEETAEDVETPAEEVAEAEEPKAEEETPAEEAPAEESEAPAAPEAAEEKAAEEAEESAEAGPDDAAAEEDVAPAMLAVTAPEFEPLKAGYRRETRTAVSAAVTNEGEEPVVIRAARIGGNSAKCFTLDAEKNVTIEPGETNDSAWPILPKANLRAGEYSARLILILESGETIEVPFTFTVEKG